MEGDSIYVPGPRGWLIGVRRQGASHIARGAICQDALHYDVSGELGLVVGVADGHGGERYDRSDVGARKAVEIAVTALNQLWVEHAGSKEILANILRGQFFDNFLNTWRTAVLAHDRAQLVEVSPDEAQKSEERIIERYGTTLIVALLTNEFCLVGRIGDGDALLLNSQSCEELLEPDLTLFGTTTHSLCALAPTQNWHVRDFDTRIGDVLLLSTDGFRDAFASRDDFLTYGKELVQRLAQFGQSAIAKKLPEWLDQCSREGSGDDITVILAATDSIKDKVSPGSESGDGTK